MARLGGGDWRHLTPPNDVKTGQSRVKGSTTLDPDKHSSTAIIIILQQVDLTFARPPWGGQGRGLAAPRYALVHSDCTEEALAVTVDVETVIKVKENCSTEGAATPEATSSGSLTRTDLALVDHELLGRAEP